MKRCPICGGEVVLQDHTKSLYGFEGYRIVCEQCNLYMNSSPTRELKFIDGRLTQTQSNRTKSKVKQKLISTWDERKESETKVTKKFYTCQEVAERYDVKISTVWSWVREKKLPAVKLGKNYKVRHEDLMTFEARNITTAENS